MPIVMLTTAAVVAGAAAYEVASRKVPGVNVSDLVEVKLLPLERSLALYDAPICTITFCEGNYQQAATNLKARVDQIVQANPWLGGWLGHRNKGGLKLFYDDKGERLTSGIFLATEPGQVDLCREDLHYDQLGNTLAPVAVKRSTQLVGEKDSPLWCVVVVPDRDQPNTRFAVVVSMSHVVGDVHTYYKLYNMLSSSHHVQPMNPQRNQDFPKALKEIMGKQEAQYINKTTSGRKKREEMVKLLFYISEEWVAKEKEKLLHPIREDSKDEKSGSLWCCQSASNVVESSPPATEPIVDKAAVEFLSTNEIITSWFWKTVKATTGLLHYDFRDRVPDCSELHAGNYYNTLPFTETDYRNPVSIQQSLKHDKCGGLDETQTKLATSKRATSSISVDWIGVQQELALDSVDNFKAGLHFPCYDTVDLANLPTKLSFIICFKAGPEEKLGAFLVAPKAVLPEIEASGIMEEVLAKF